MGGSGDPIFFLDISSSLVERSLHAKFQLPRLPRSGSSMVGDKKNKTTENKKNSVELYATLAPAEAEVGAVAKADQKKVKQQKCRQETKTNCEERFYSLTFLI